MNAKTIVYGKKIIVGILAHAFVRMVSVSTNMINDLSPNVTSVVLNSDDEKARYKMDSYILHVVLLVVKLLFIVVILCCDYTLLNISKKKSINAVTI